MEVTLWLEIGLFAILMLLSGFFSSSETALFSLNDRQIEQLRREKNPQIGLIERLLSGPRRLIVTILIGNELVNVAASVLSAAVVIRFFGDENKWINLVFMIPLLLLVGEITPKTLAIRNNVAFATFQARYIDFFAKLITPIRLLVRHIAEIFITLITGAERSPSNIITEDMVRSLTEEAVGEGALDVQEARYINRIFDFGDTLLRDVMTPRSQIQFLSLDMSLAEMATELSRTRHTKVPVYDGQRESVVGILFARDILGVSPESRAEIKGQRAISRYLRKPYFVPETKLAADTFHTFRQRRLSLALTLDEYGGITGLVTREDLLECIFGEIRSTSEVVQHEALDIEDLGDGRFRLDSALEIRLFNSHFERELPEDEFESLSGLLLQKFGELPREGDSVDIGECHITIDSIAHHRIGKIVVEFPSDTPPEGAPAPETAAPEAAGEEAEAREDA